MLQNWFEKNGITYKGIDIVQVQGSAHIVASQHLNTDEVVASIPKSAILSPRNSKIGKYLRRNMISGGLALTIAVLYEQSVGTRSKWYGYLQSLPKYEPLPIFWQQVGFDDAMKALKGTSLDGIDEELELLKEDFQELELPFKCTFEEFCMASSLVSSRCFDVDSIHGDSLVPFADLFNHKTDGEHIHLESEDDLQNIDLRVFSNCQKGSQVFNTYGQRDNAFLLKKYGFSEPSNAYDYVKFDYDWVMVLFNQASIEDLESVSSFSSAGDDELVVYKDGTCSESLQELLSYITDSQDEALSILAQARLSLYMTDNEVDQLQPTDQVKFALQLRSSEMQILRQLL